MSNSPQPNPIILQKVLAGLDYPDGKADLTRRVKAHGPDGEMIRALENRHEREFDSPLAVSRAAAEPPARR